MLDGNLMDFVGRQVMRKSDAKRGKISGLLNYGVVHPDKTIGVETEDDMIFEMQFPGEDDIFIVARSSVIAASDFKLL